MKKIEIDHLFNSEGFLDVETTILQIIDMYEDHQEVDAQRLLRKVIKRVTKSDPIYQLGLHALEANLQIN